MTKALPAILAGMAGVLSMHSMGLVKLHLKPTTVAANVGGGLIFGAGFALLGYCLGSAAVALGEGHWDALFGMAGLVAGSYFYAECSPWLDRNISQRGNYGKVTLPEFFNITPGLFIPVFASLLAAALMAGWLFPLDPRTSTPPQDVLLEQVETPNGK